MGFFRFLSWALFWRYPKEQQPVGKKTIATETLNITIWPYKTCEPMPQELVKLDCDLYRAEDISCIELAAEKVVVHLRTGRTIATTCPTKAAARRSCKEWQDAWRAAVTGIIPEPAQTTSDTED
jgi:hypothetical protein